MGSLLGRSKLFLSRNASTILTCIGGAGVIATSVLAVKATPKALKLIEKAEEEKGENLTKLETVKVAGPVYIPSIIMGASTIACIFGANVLNKRQQAAITSAYALLSNSYKEYKKKVEELYGEEAGTLIREELAKDKYEEQEPELDFGDNKRLFYDEFSERYFETTMEAVIHAEYELNKKIALHGGVSLNEFYELLDIPAMDYGESLGWSSGSLMETTWSQWLDFKHEKVLVDDDLECVIISTNAEPYYDYLYY